ncbi:CD9 antigen-like [Babylonia areolata]|uniref:CD9 antigen-like n=1 Tax=Babylonia areolata TaxID=304850 RepID=UPI003FCF3C09
MALEGCAACLKYVMIIWNFLILILGFAIVGVGVWMVVDKDSGKFVDEAVGDESPFIINYSDVSDPNLYQTLAYILIVFGAITVIIAFLGYCGAVRESQCLLATCFGLLFIIFAALVGVGIYLYIKKDEIDVDKERLAPIIRDALDSGVRNYDSDEESKNFMDAVQKRYDCCGAENGISDYKLQLPPASCSPLVYNKGCFDPYFKDVQESIGVKQFFSDKMTIAMAAALGVAGALILAMILTLVLCCSVRRSGSY